MSLARIGWAQRDRVFQQVDNPNNNSEWTDVSINCHYVGTFEVGEAAKVNKEEVGVVIWLFVFRPTPSSTLKQQHEGLTRSGGRTRSRPGLTR